MASYSNNKDCRDPNEDDSSSSLGGSALRRKVQRVSESGVALAQDWIAAEVPIALRYNDEPHAVMMATPDDVEDFARGFSLSEAIVESIDEIESIDIHEHLEGIEVSVRVRSARAEVLSARRRSMPGRSSCGVCGMQDLANVVRHAPEVGVGPVIDRASLHRALAELSTRQPLNAKTGATHAAGWSDAKGNMVLVREDVGRHNALDKLIGAMALSDANRDKGFLVLTSRTSYEMVQKAATVQMALIAAISAPTALAIHLADSARITLIGFARAASCVIYSHPERIIDSEI